MIGRIGSVEGRPLSGEGIESVVKRLLVGPADGWQGWALRLFELAPGGHTPRHRHPWPHVDYITAGHGTLHIDGADNPVETGSFASVGTAVSSNMKWTQKGSSRLASGWLAIGPTGRVASTISRRC